MVSIAVSIQVTFLPYPALDRRGRSRGMSKYSSNLPVSRVLVRQPDKREVGSSTLPRPIPLPVGRCYRRQVTTSQRLRESEAFVVLSAAARPPSPGASLAVKALGEKHLEQ
jgi:hypothetical protein